MHTSSRTKMAIASAMAVCFVEAAFTAQPVGAPAHAAMARAAAQPSAHTGAQPAGRAAYAPVSQTSKRTATVKPAWDALPEGEICGGWLEDPDEAGWFAKRLEIGWRVARPKADTKQRWHDAEHYGFLGTMEKFDEADEYDFLNFVISYKLCDWIAIGATWDSISEVATTRSSDNHEDGEWKEHGPSVSAILTTPRIFNLLSPYAEFGLHFPTGTFDPYSWWSLGYPSPAYYSSIGSPATSNGTYRRVITAHESDSTTYLWGVGLKVYVTDNLALDVAYRHIDCDIDAEYRLYSRGRLLSDHGAYKIPLSYTQLCLGIRLAF